MNCKTSPEFNCVVFTDFNFIVGRVSNLSFEHPKKSIASANIENKPEYRIFVVCNKFNYLKLNTESKISKWEDKIFEVNASDFEDVALAIFQAQVSENETYKAYLQALQVDPNEIEHINDIPFLPISLFKSHQVTTGNFKPQIIFESSGTTQINTSKHLVKSTALYEKSFVKTFEWCYGNIKDWCIVGLLPGYLERKNSSLVYMVQQLIQLSEHDRSGFFLYDHERLIEIIRENERRRQPTLLIGVTYALIDFANKYKGEWAYTTVMETGGMKGTRKEITRSEVHEILKNAWAISSVHSEYGMTELLSQAYSKGIYFQSPPWLKIGVREYNDPFSVTFSTPQTKSGIINVIDLANLYSCCFIATDDVGKLYPDGSFEVMGRRDESDVRGCSLLTV